MAHYFVALTKTSEGDIENPKSAVENKDKPW
jgi:hypothetical protein